MSYVKQKMNALAAGKPILIISASDCSRLKITSLENSYEHLTPDKTTHSTWHIADHFNVHFPEIGLRLATNLPVSTLNTPHYLKGKPSSFEFVEMKSR